MPHTFVKGGRVGITGCKGCLVQEAATREVFEYRLSCRGTKRLVVAVHDGLEFFVFIHSDYIIPRVP